jgi:hypothetical protein
MDPKSTLLKLPESWHELGDAIFKTKVVPNKFLLLLDIVDYLLIITGSVNLYILFGVIKTLYNFE